MSDISTSPSTITTGRAGATHMSWSRWAGGVALAAAGAAAVNTLVALGAVAALDVHEGFDPLQSSAPAVSSVVAAAGAGIVLALLHLFTARPVRNFLVVSAVVLVLSFAPLVQLGMADPPEYPGTTGGALAVLGLMHVVAAAVVVPVLATFPFPRPGES